MHGNKLVRTETDAVLGDIVDGCFHQRGVFGGVKILETAGYLTSNSSVFSFVPYVLQ